MKRLFRDGYGISVFIATTLVTAATIAYVFWNEDRLKQKRQANVKNYVRTRQQLENMEKYRLQQQIYDDYKKSD